MVNILNKGEFHVPSKTGKNRLLKKTRKISPQLLLNYTKFVKDIKKLLPKFKWCDNMYLVTNEKVLKNTKDLFLGDYGNYYNDNKNYPTQYWAIDEKNRALVCHESCYKLLHKKLNYNLKIEDVEQKLNYDSLLSNYGNAVNKYVGFQFFPWMSMILNTSFSNFQSIMNDNKKLEIDYNNVNYLLDPLKNNENEKRIINIWNPIIKQIKSRSRSKSKRKHSRPSPSDSATLFKLGHKEKGNDGNIYIVTETKNNVKLWTKLK